MFILPDYGAEYCFLFTLKNFYFGRKSTISVLVGIFCFQNNILVIQCNFIFLHNFFIVFVFIPARYYTWYVTFANDVVNGVNESCLDED